MRARSFGSRKVDSYAGHADGRVCAGLLGGLGACHRQRIDDVRSSASASASADAYVHDAVCADDGADRDAPWRQVVDVGAAASAVRQFPFARLARACLGRCASARGGLHAAAGRYVGSDLGDRGRSRCGARCWRSCRLEKEALGRGDFLRWQSLSRRRVCSVGDGWRIRAPPAVSRRAVSTDKTARSRRLLRSGKRTSDAPFFGRSRTFAPHVRVAW